MLSLQQPESGPFFGRGPPLEWCFFAVEECPVAANQAVIRQGRRIGPLLTLTRHLECEWTRAISC